MPATLRAALSVSDITTPTPIQAATLADSLAGRDILGRGPTGSGKTYAFLLPLVARLAEAKKSRRPKMPRALILAPTRELVRQIETALRPLARTAGLTAITVFGGVSAGPQISGLRSGVDIVLACPGRLEDLIQQRACSLDAVEITVLDEADHMADLGFLPSVKRLLAATPSRGQRMLFSATLDNAVGVLVQKFLHDPVTFETAVDNIPAAQLAHHVLNVSADQHLPVLTDLAGAPGRTVVFTRTKHRAKAFARRLNAAGIPAVELHGNLNQNARTRSLESFQSGRVGTLVATDIAARGIHIDDVELVVHADPPIDPKAYVHRSGRTARAGKAGTVVTLVTEAQRGEVRRLTKAAGVTPTITDVRSITHPILTELAPGPRTRVAPSAVDLTPVPDRTGRSERADRSGGASASGRPARRGGPSRRTDRPAPATRPASSGARSSGGPRSANAAASSGGRPHNAATFSAGRRSRSGR